MHMHKCVYTYEQIHICNKYVYISDICMLYVPVTPDTSNQEAEATKREINRAPATSGHFWQAGVYSGLLGKLPYFHYLPHIHTRVIQMKLLNSNPVLATSPISRKGVWGPSGPHSMDYPLEAARCGFHVNLAECIRARSFRILKLNTTTASTPLSSIVPELTLKPPLKQQR